METTARWNSCRLAAHSDSGRIRWCIGHERTWKCKLKILAFVPIILLIGIGTAMLISHLSHKVHKRVIRSESFDPNNYRDEEILDEEDRDVLHDIRTSYVPKPKLTLRNIYYRQRKKREVTKQNVKSYLNTNNDTADDRELLINRSTFWKDKVSKEEIRKTQAKFMLDYMDRTADPCADFYRYSCGNWEKYNKIPPDKSGYDTFEILRESIDTVLKGLLLEDEAEESKVDADEALHLFPFNNLEYVYQKYNNVANDTHQLSINKSIDAVIKVKNLYKSCINEDEVNKRGIKPLLNLLHELGGWPALDPKWNESKFDWIWLAAQLKKYNNDILIAEWVGPDIKNSNEYIIQFDQTTLGLPSREYYLDETNNKYLEAYRIYMLTIINLLGVPIVKATENVDEMINFETQLAEIIVPPEERNNLTDIYIRSTIGELQALIPQIELLRYITLVSEQQIPSTQQVVCYSLNYLQNLVVLISNTPPRVITNYLLWRFVRHRINNLDYRFLEAKQRFYYFLYGREKSPPRWQTCVTQVNANMGMVVGNLFVKKYFDENSKNDTISMTHGIRKSFRELLNSKSWLDNDTKDYARLKLDSMKLRIGYPESILDRDELSEKYLDVKIDSKLYFENTLNLLRHLTQTEHERLGAKVNKMLWNTAPAVVNAYYSRNKNQIIFPAGILQPPFYHKYFPHALNYGGIGVVIGHEITHGFDDKGRLFDQEGNLERWWQDQSVNEFNKRAKCLINQYNAYTLPDVSVQVDGESTQGENIADNGGIKQSFKAYQSWLEANPNKNELLPGIDLTNTQLFFLNFAQIWCGISRPEATRNKMKTAVHSPGQFRIIGSLRNSIEFAEAYNCPLGSPMNPKDKCVVW